MAVDIIYTRNRKREREKLLPLAQFIFLPPPPIKKLFDLQKKLLDWPLLYIPSSEATRNSSLERGRSRPTLARTTAATIRVDTGKADCDILPRNSAWLR